MNSTYWFEQLPESCPPQDAEVSEGVYYRLISSTNPDSKDFLSQRALSPYKIFQNVDECIARSLSVFNNYTQLKAKLKLPKFRNYHIAEIELTNTDGMIKKTFGPSHFSWWRSTNFKVEKAIVLD